MLAGDLESHRSVEVIIDVASCGRVDDDIVAIKVPVEFCQLLLEVDVCLLVLFAALAVLICPHLAVVATVILEHITERADTFALSFRKD